MTNHVATNTTIKFQAAAWLISAATVILAIGAWGQGLQWHIASVSAYGLFPVFGLIAFSLMWAHYMVVAMRHRFQIDRAVLASYFRWTGFGVLFAIILHPAILALKLYNSGAGLPPGSYKTYIGPVLYGVVVLGIINFFLLLAFELNRFFGHRPWWHYYTYVIDAVMFSVFYHALRLGSNLHSGWYRDVWWFYGISLTLALIYIYISRYREHPERI